MIRGTIHNATQLVDLIQQVGFLPLLYSDIPGYNVGDILTATGDTFTSRKGSWIYTWSKSGKKLSTRPAPK